MAPPIAGWYRERQHLRHRARVYTEPARRLPPTKPLDLNRVADLPIQLHELHPQPSAFNAESFLLLEFYSGAAGPPGRFSEGFLLRRLHFLARVMYKAVLGTHYKRKEQKKEEHLAIF